MKKKANIYDVAALAGVSHQTVSRVLNNHASLRPETREKVERAIAKLEYRPNLAARQLVTSRSLMIGLLVTGSDLYGPSSILNAMEREARAAGYSVISFSVNPESRDSWQDGIEQLRRLNIDGVITIALPQKIIGDIEKSLTGVALVVVDTEPTKKIDVVNVDNVSGGEMATQHLIDLGHTLITHISGPVNAYEAQTRQIGYEAAMNRAGLSPNVVVGDWSIETGYKAVLSLLKKSKTPSAIFCANDHLAIGAMKALHELGHQVPVAMSIIGFDDLPESAYLIPSLTTIRQNFDRLGELAINRVLSQIQKSSQHETLMIKPQLIARSSTEKKRNKDVR